MRCLLLVLLPLTACLPKLADDTGLCNGLEVCNGEDDDCDGQIDEDAADAPLWFPDTDGDGFGVADATIAACSQPSGYAANAEDCDDSDAGAHPGAEEVWYDGTDQDCDGNDDDRDDDGYDLAEDCDDTDPEVHPDAAEVWYDGTDQDCDGNDDDQDQDGWPLAEDCDDTDRDVNPDAEETWYDGTDQDCDGGDDFDQDGDGYPLAEDCDDTDPAVHPGLLDWVDGVDQDCDGDVDFLALGNAPVVLAGAVPGDEAGTAVTGAGDVDGDGFDDVLVGAYESDVGAEDGGAVYVLRGPIVSGSVGTATARLLGTQPSAMAGYSLSAAGDVDGDGFDDVLLGAPMEGAEDDALTYVGAAYLVRGPLAGDVALSGADLRMQAEGLGGAGWAVAGGADFTGDGGPDLVIGAPDESSLAVSGGAAYVVAGTTLGSTTLASATISLSGDQDEALVGTAVAASDFDGDGAGDLLVGAPGWGDDGDVAGAVLRFDGAPAGVLSAADADAYLGGLPGDDAGACVAAAGDVDGDGRDDFLVGAPDVDRDAGAVYLVHGVATAGSLLYVAAATFAGPESGASLCAAAAPGDVDGDGDGDLLLGAYRWDADGTAESGGAWLVAGPFGGTLGLADADLVFYGSIAGDYAGFAVAGAGDTDADGHPDLLIGAPFSDAGGAASGAAYLVPGGPR